MRRRYFFILLLLFILGCNLNHEGNPPHDFGSHDIVYSDPGSGPWLPVPKDSVLSVCGLDPILLEDADKIIDAPYAIVRYGRLCHEYYPENYNKELPSPTWSATKTLSALVFGIAAYQTKTLIETGPKTGPLTELDRVDHWLDNHAYSINPDAHIEHVLAMVAFNQNLAYEMLEFSYDALGEREVQSLAEIIETALAQRTDLQSTGLADFTQEFLFDPLGMQNSTWPDSTGTPKIAYGWNSTVRDMARLGLLMLNEGIWDGERILDASWIYKMTHPSFESSNPRYGYLTWLGADCSPSPVHSSYPHGLSEAEDCGYPTACMPKYDIGVWQAAGVGGQFIMGHKGLDLLLISKDLYPFAYPLSNLTSEFWQAVRPALVFADPHYQGDESKFCEDYSSGNYAPALH